MRVVVLVEDTTGSDCVYAEHGLSLFIENGANRFLFDLGMTGLFARNAQTLGISVESIETLVFSHGHCDHTGGLSLFGELNSKANIYVTPTTFRSYYSLRAGNVFEDIGTPLFDVDERFLKRIVFNYGVLKLFDGTILFSDIKTNELLSEANEHLFMLDQRGQDISYSGRFDKCDSDLFRRDLFEHEQNLIITTETGRKVLFVGCSHRGIINIMLRCVELLGCPPDVAFGGFHLTTPSKDSPIPSETLDRIAERLAGWPTKYFVGHCVGQFAFDRIQRVLNNQVAYFRAGESFVF